jgi:hypothetical protein
MSVDYEKIGRRTVELLEAVASFVEAWRGDRPTGNTREALRADLDRARVCVVEVAAELAPELRDRVLRAIPMEPTEAAALGAVFRFDA